MCFHGNQPSWGINHSFISLYFKYQSPRFTSIPVILAPVISSLDEIYCTNKQVSHSSIPLSRVLFPRFCAPSPPTFFHCFCFLKLKVSWPQGRFHPPFMASNFTSFIFTLGSEKRKTLPEEKWPMECNINMTLHGAKERKMDKGFPTDRNVE